MTSAEDLRTALALIDARLAEQESGVEQSDGVDGETVPGRRIELLRALRVAVQRRAILQQRLARSEEEVAERREQLAAIDEKGVTLEPPYTVSALDQQQAELGLTRATEAVAKARLATASRRLTALEKSLDAAVRARRNARDQLSAGSDDGVSEVEREHLAQALELAQLQELLARQQLAAAEASVALARTEDRLAEAQQQVLAARVTFLESHAQLPPELLEQRLEELHANEAQMRAQIETLLRQDDQAESALYQAQRRLAAADGADKVVLEEWVAARQSELDASHSAVDSLTAAIVDLGQMRQLWQQRFELMQASDAGDAAERLRAVITAAAAARAGKDEIEDRLNALRTIELAQARRLRDPDLNEGMRQALAVRAAAQELAERAGRELLETRDALIALLAGMRDQLEAQVESRPLGLQLLQAQEALASWWDAELIVIDDQSITAGELGSALAMFVLVLVVVSLIRIGARHALQRRKAKDPVTEAGDLRLALSAVSGNTSQLFVLIAAFYVAMIFSGLAGTTVRDWLWNVLVIAFYAQLGLWANAAMVDYFSRRRTRQEMRDPSAVTGYGLLMFFIRVGVWITVVVSLLAYFKYPVAGLVGALGVGSLAVAFAVQNILGDVFSSMAIILDKPFRVGDFVKTGDTVGTIELIGVKTTRIRSLSGEQVVLSNSDLLSSRVHNFKHFRERRVSFRIRVAYWTPREQIERIPGMIREAIEAQPRTRFDRAHFFELGESSLIFEVVYYVLTPDYGVYMDIQQGINLVIHRRFEEAGIELAYPTQELIVRHGRSAATASAGVAST